MYEYQLLPHDLLRYCSRRPNFLPSQLPTFRGYFLAFAEPDIPNQEFVVDHPDNRTYYSVRKLAAGTSSLTSAEFVHEVIIPMPVSSPADVPFDGVPKIRSDLARLLRLRFPGEYPRVSPYPIAKQRVIAFRVWVHGLTCNRPTHKLHELNATGNVYRFGVWDLLLK